MNSNLLEVSGLHVSAGEKEILHGVDLTVGKDETHVLMGPNGTGKSTLGHAITGNPEYTVTAGKIVFDGEDITRRSAPLSAVRSSRRPASASASGTSRRSLPRRCSCWRWTLPMLSAT